MRPQKIHARTVLFASLFLFLSLLPIALIAQDLNQPPEKVTLANAPPFENSTLITIFPKFDIALDTALANIGEMTREIPSNIKTLLIYKLKIRWPFKEELRFAELQFLSSYFEQKIRSAMSKEKRFGLLYAQDLKTLSFKATDSSLQVKNTYTEDELRSYAKARNVDGVINADILISPNQLILFVNVNDLNGITVWSKELKSEYRVIPVDAVAELEAQYKTKEKTGLIENYFTVGFKLATAYKSGAKDSAGVFGYFAVGYRMNEMATILDFLKFYIDAKVVGTSKLGMMGILAMPGFSFQLIGNESGPAILLLDASAGFNISFKNGVAECFGGGLTFRLSRNIGLTGFYTYIPIKESFGNWDIAGPLYGFQVNFIL